ncbi:MAG: RHS repeat-associated core domain-containing protein, partial [Lachnospiraceae bacterium]|nr:RHS repeat-associated core domain-containing protein [Lachnospiraceae bacterium]
MLSAIKTIDTSNQTVAEYQYSRNANGAITNIAETLQLRDGTVSEKNTAYTYDSVSRLIREEISNAKGSIQFTYGYDETYNRISQTISFDGEVEKLIDETGAEEVREGEISYTYNALNQLIKESETGADGTSQETIYEYDTDGNLIKEVAENEVKTYTYDVNGYMKSVVIETTKDDTISITQESYGYDAEGVRVWKETEDVTTIYITDRFDTYTQVLVEQKSSGETDYYTRGNRLVCRTANDDSKVFYLYDGHGNVTALTDNLGNVTDNYSYTAYGVLLTKAGETENEYLYCGEQMDATTGLYYLRARYFNPLTATFTQKDSYEGNLYSPVTQNGYLYTGGNPVMYADPSGNEATLSEMATVIGIMGIVSSVVVVNYQHYIAPYLAMRAQMCWDNLVSTAGALRNAFEAAKQSLSDSWEILVVPERITNTIVDGIPVRVREVAIEIFPSIVQEEWKEVFPAHIEEDNRIILGPQVIDREVWDNIMWSTGGKASDLPTIEKGTKEWDEAVKSIANGGNTSYRTRT